MRVICHMSVLARGCPQSTSHHYAFISDLCDVRDVAVSFLSALQDRTQGGNNYKPFLLVQQTERLNVNVLGLF